MIVATKPSQVTNLKLTSSDTSITAKWSAVSGASGYRIYVYNSSTKKYKLKKTVSSTSSKITGLKPNKTYKVKVAAFKSCDNMTFVGTKSKAIKIKTKNKRVTLSSAKSKKKKKITVKWKKKSGISGYQVMWSTSSNFKKNFLSRKISGSSKTSTTLTKQTRKCKNAKDNIYRKK